MASSRLIAETEMLEPCFSSGQRVALDDLRSHSHRLKNHWLASPCAWGGVGVGIGTGVAVDVEVGDGGGGEGTN
jgi:hypothetical protein